MKRFSAVLAFVLIITSVFSFFAYAAAETRTEKFFAIIEKNKSVTLYEPMKNEDMGGFSYEKVSMQVVEDENGETVSELYGSAKLWFVDIDMYATQGGMLLYLPQINRHLDFFYIFGDEAENITEIFSDYDETDLMPLPSYPEYMSLKSSTVESDVDGYGDLYTETFVYDTESVVADLVSKDIIPDPALYDISLDDNKALSEFYWNYAGDYSGFASSLLYKNEATFTFNEKGQLVAADYFTGEGRDVYNEYYELGEIGGFEAGASAEDFEIPESSKDLKVLTMFLKFFFKLLLD